uniref:Secreted protein n=1 Tax=Craspedostauros australis TaxID=1486917 RepID=A0A7R9WNH1_9STRA|mmetsp:Transcript_11429/g.31639  ORF Transcript_11429/g.31639 Transcript_11429/m.31639 type:complete len:122 (+) Transcript_11429:847-1212(+)
MTSCQSLASCAIFSLCFTVQEDEYRPGYRATPCRTFPAIMSIPISVADTNIPLPHPLRGCSRNFSEGMCCAISAGYGTIHPLVGTVAARYWHTREAGSNLSSIAWTRQAKTMRLFDWQALR